MEIAALVCNDKLNYESAFQIYSLYEYDTIIVLFIVFYS